jgi:hypothetical protein
MPDANALNASFMCLIIAIIHISTYAYTEQIISLMIGSVFIFLSYKLYVYGDWSTGTPSGFIKPNDSINTLSEEV